MRMMVKEAHFKGNNQGGQFAALQHERALAPKRDMARARLVMEMVALSTGVGFEQIRSSTRNCARAARARQVAMYLTYVSFQWPLSRIGKAFGRDRTTVGYACRLIEDLRDNHDFDARLSQLESSLENMPRDADVKLLNLNLREMAV